MITRRCALIKFAKGVLEILESHSEWDDDTIDDIGMLAIDSGLAETCSDGSFKIKEGYTN